MITKPIPNEAYLVVQEFVRADVQLPEANMWEASNFKNGKEITPCLRCDGFCPMGFHPKAIGHLPSSGRQLPCSPSDAWDKSVGKFWRWWDDQTDAAAALAEIERVKKLVA